jgi:MFS superfamily sulfate permease-like transporter
MKVAEPTGIRTASRKPRRDRRTPWIKWSNRFDRHEWAGAFGDLGTLIPFVVGYISVVGMDPCAVLFVFGVAMVASGMHYGTPVPVQPMKAIGAAAAAQSAHAAVSIHTVAAAGLVTGALWLVLGLTGFAKRLRAWISDGVAIGIVVGLGLSLAWTGLTMVANGWLLGIVTFLLTVALLRFQAIPTMLLLLVFSFIVALIQNPELANQLRVIHPQLRLPVSSLPGMSWADLVTGTVLLALPQLPLTLGNAVIATTRENNRLFPERMVSEGKLMISTGVMNLGSALTGGIPMCHGAGGMAAHVRFGARTGGAPVILGTILLVLALGFSTSIETMFRMFPSAILGVILLLAGMQLVLGARSSIRPADVPTRWVIGATAVLVLWNVAAGFVAGMIADQLVRSWRRRTERKP